MKIDKRYVLVFLLPTLAMGASLSSRLMSTNPSTQDEARQEALGLPQDELNPVINDLIRALKKKSDPDSREHAAEALGLLGPAAKNALGPLRSAANDEFPYVRIRAAEAVIKIDPSSVPQEKQSTKAEPIIIGKKPKAPTPAPADLVSETLPQAVSPAAPVPITHPVVPKKKVPIKKKLIAKKTKVPEAPPPPPPTPEALLAVTVSTTTAIKSEAETDMILRSSETLPVLLAALQGPSTLYADEAMTLLDRIGTPESKKALDVYRQKQQDKRLAKWLKELRSEGSKSDEAVKQLAKIGAPSVAPVSAMLSDPRASTRRAAATVLNQLGPVAQPATIVLSAALDDWDDGVRLQSSQALTKIGTPDAQKALRFFAFKVKARHIVNSVHPMAH